MGQERMSLLKTELSEEIRTKYYWHSTLGMKQCHLSNGQLYILNFGLPIIPK